MNEKWKSIRGERRPKPKRKSGIISKKNPAKVGKWRVEEYFISWNRFNIAGFPLGFEFGDCNLKTASTKKVLLLFCKANGIKEAHISFFPAPKGIFMIFFQKRIPRGTELRRGERRLANFQVLFSGENEFFTPPELGIPHLCGGGGGGGQSLIKISDLVTGEEFSSPSFRPPVKKGSLNFLGKPRATEQGEFENSTRLPQDRNLQLCSFYHPPTPTPRALRAKFDAVFKASIYNDKCFTFLISILLLNSWWAEKFLLLTPLFCFFF